MTPEGLTGKVQGHAHRNERNNTEERVAKGLPPRLRQERNVDTHRARRERHAQSQCHCSVRQAHAGSVHII